MDRSSDFAPVDRAAKHSIITLELRRQLYNACFEPGSASGSDGRSPRGKPVLGPRGRGQRVGPGRSLEELTEIVTYRRADGRQIGLDEFPLTEGLTSGETVRAEEIVLSVPDGRSVATLLNATPIPGADGDAIESVVVTMQDLQPLNELERQRAEFLGLVSHELRAPLTAIKGSAATVLSAPTELDRAELREFFRIVDEQADQMRGLISDLLDVGRIETGTLSVDPAPTELATLVDQARITFLSANTRHPVHIDLARHLPHVMVDRQRIAQVLNNLLATLPSGANPHCGNPGGRPCRGLGHR